MSASTFNTGQLVELSDDSTALKDGTRGTVMGSKKNGKVVVSFPGPVRNLMTSKIVRPIAHLAFPDTHTTNEI